jgi:hypothetical protein
LLEEETMRVMWLGALAAVALGIALAANPAETPQKDLVVHEWGVISVYNDVELANADMRAAWAGLPKFVYGNIDQRSLPPRVIVIEAPLIYFHTPGELAIKVKVEFPGGRPAVWWPANSNDGSFSGGLAAKIPPPTSDKYLEWELNLQKPAPKPETDNSKAFAKLRPLPEGHWMEACRAVDAAEVGSGWQREKFVYYDGLIPSPRAAEPTVTTKGVSLRNCAKHALLDVTAIDRRTPGRVRLARVAKLDAGKSQTLEFREAAVDRWPAVAIDELVTQLTTADLNLDEAKALAAVWKKDFFETEGLNLFYRLPQAEYDRMLPLTIKPRPEKIARVLLVHHPHCEPDLGDRVMALVKQLDSSSFQERLDAHRRLQALGRAAFIHLVRARNAKPSLEVTARLNKLLEDFESERAFGPGDAADE